VIDEEPTYHTEVFNENVEVCMRREGGYLSGTLRLNKSVKDCRNIKPNV